VPTIIISSDTDKLKAGESTTITFTLSEKNTELFTSAPSTLVLPAASLNLSLATEIVPAVALLAVGVKVAV
jgi:hypothetical protein